MKQYLDLLQHVLDHGRKREDRTGVGTIGVFGYQMRFNLADGFPLVTTKKMFLRGCIEELLWFLRGSTDNNELVERSVHIWNQWQVGTEDINFNLDTPGRTLVRVKPRRCIDSGYYNPDSSGFSAPNGTVDDKLRSLWFKMLDRCYNKTAHNYKFYGAVGIHVCERWHKLINFIDDVKKLPNWINKLNDWNRFNLDKDYYGSNCYSPETTVWLSEEENILYKGFTTIILAPDGSIEVFPSQSSAADALGCPTTNISRWIYNNKTMSGLKRKNKRFNGWRIMSSSINYRYSFPKPGELGPIYGAQWCKWKLPTTELARLGKELAEGQNKKINPNEILSAYDKGCDTINQIERLIKALQERPYSRRHCISAWNVAYLPDEDHTPEENVVMGNMALAPCHAFFQFYVEDLTDDEIWAQAPEHVRRALLADGVKWNDWPEDLPIDKYPPYNGRAPLEGMILDHDLKTKRLSCQLYQRSSKSAFYA